MRIAEPSTDRRRSVAIFDWRQNDITPSNCHRQGSISSRPLPPGGGRYLVTIITIIIPYSVNCRCAGKEADDFCVSRFSRLRQATDAGGEDHEDRSATTHYHHLPDRPHLRYLRRLVFFTARRYAPLFHPPVSCPIFFIFLGFKPPMGFPA